MYYLAELGPERCLSMLSTSIVRSLAAPPLHSFPTLATASICSQPPAVSTFSLLLCPICSYPLLGSLPFLLLSHPPFPPSLSPLLTTFCSARSNPDATAWWARIPLNGTTHADIIDGVLVRILASPFPPIPAATPCPPLATHPPLFLKLSVPQPSTCNGVYLRWQRRPINPNTPLAPASTQSQPPAGNGVHSLLSLTILCSAPHRGE